MEKVKLDINKLSDAARIYYNHLGVGVDCSRLEKVIGSKEALLARIQRAIAEGRPIDEQGEFGLEPYSPEWDF